MLVFGKKSSLFLILYKELCENRGIFLHIFWNQGIT